MDKHTLGSWLNARIRERGISSIRAAARQIGISHPLLSDLLNDQFGRSGPTLDTMKLIAEWADIPVAYLYDLIDKSAGRDVALEAEMAAFLYDYPMIREFLSRLFKARNEGRIDDETIRRAFRFAELESEALSKKEEA